MPDSFMSVMTGPMMNRERNSARPASTWFGGMDGSASAFRAMARTTKILVNDVIINSSAGATESSVMPSSVMMEAEGSPFGPLISIDTPPTSSSGEIGSPGGTGSTGAA